MNYKVSVITVNFNQKEVTEALLQSIFTTRDASTLEIIVVDNGSRENHVPEWRIKYPAITFIRSEKNLGFAGGNNLGIGLATGNYLFFVNNDTEFTTGLVDTLANTLDKHPDVGMVSPKIRFFQQPDTLQYAGFTPMNYYTCRNKCIGFGEKDNGQYDSLTGETGYIHGAAMMVRRAALAKAELMPECYFLYYEEMDWCEQVRRAGYTTWVNMQALIYHKESVSVGVNSPLKEYFMNRNRILFIRRNCKFPVTTIFWLYFIFIVAPRNIISYLKQKRLNFIGVLFRAIFWNVSHGAGSNDLGYEV